MKLRLTSIRLVMCIGLLIIVGGALFYAFSFNSSTYTLSSYDQYKQWLNNPENGLVQQRTVNGLKLTVQHIPADYMTYMELDDQREISKRTRDSLMELYESNYAFRLSIKPKNKNSAKNVMWRGVQNYDEYKKRIHQLQFRSKNMVALKIGRQKYKPVLANMESDYQLNKGIELIFVFAPKREQVQSKTGRIDFVFEDPVFHTGITHYQFEKDDIRETPTFKFWN